MRLDPVQLHQILVNLALNARDAMPAGGTLRIETSPRHDTKDLTLVALIVSDSGEGMDEQTRTQAFEPFFTTKDVGKGTGLGLSTVHGIVAHAGGTVTIESERGQGTTITILLPATAEHPVSDKTLIHPAPPTPPTSGTILLVEDEEIVRDALRATIETLGYTVIAPPTPEEGLEIAQTTDISLVLTDVTMPGLTGTELAAALAQTKPHLPVLLMSGYSDAAEQPALPPRPLLHKPFSLAELSRTLGELLGNH